MVSPTQRPLPDNTQHSQETDIHAPGGIRTHTPSKRAAADLRFISHGHRDHYFLRTEILHLNRIPFKRPSSGPGWPRMTTA
jgi:L-ascorbate metabolism protein UlaG (beta-lactamase superfamily)